MNDIHEHIVPTLKEAEAATNEESCKQFDELETIMDAHGGPEEYLASIGADSDSDSDGDGEQRDGSASRRRAMHAEYMMIRYVTQCNPVPSWLICPQSCACAIRHILQRHRCVATSRVLGLGNSQPGRSGKLYRNQNGDLNLDATSTSGTQRLAVACHCGRDRAVCGRSHHEGHV